MNSIITAIIAALTLVIGGGAGTGSTHHGIEEGHNLCLDYNAGFLLSGSVFHPYPVTGGANYTASHDGGAKLYIDWYDAANQFLGFTDELEGVVPSRATNATFCVGTLGDRYPDIPAPGATWTYEEIHTE
jgi:hypothetical protein